MTVNNNGKIYNSRPTESTCKTPRMVSREAKIWVWETEMLCIFPLENHVESTE